MTDHDRILRDRIIDYETDNLSDQGIVELFQDLVDSGLAYKLQGSYGRMAERLIADGFVTRLQTVVA